MYELNKEIVAVKSFYIFSNTIVEVVLQSTSDYTVKSLQLYIRNIDFDEI